jgi:ribosomal protein S18 acetylase RimI-like enzyme
MEFREATTSDIEAIRTIATASWETDYPELISRETVEAGVDEWYNTDRLERELTDDETIILLAVDEQPIGFAHGVLAEGTGHLLRLYVDPDWRREGIGARLLDEMSERFAAESDVDYLRAMVLSVNEAGKAFYRANGFDAVDEARTTIGGKSYDETTFERELKATVEP